MPGVKAYCQDCELRAYPMCWVREAVAGWGSKKTSPAPLPVLPWPHFRVFSCNVLLRLEHGIAVSCLSPLVHTQSTPGIGQHVHGLGRALPGAYSNSLGQRDKLYFV